MVAFNSIKRTSCICDILRLAPDCHILCALPFSKLIFCNCPCVEPTGHPATPHEGRPILPGICCVGRPSQNPSSVPWPRGHVPRRQVLPSRGCCNKSPQTQWLQMTEFMTAVLEDRFQHTSHWLRSRGQQGCPFGRVRGESISCPSHFRGRSLLDPQSLSAPLEPAVMRLSDLPCSQLSLTLCDPVSPVKDPCGYPGLTDKKPEPPCYFKVSVLTTSAPACSPHRALRHTEGPNELQGPGYARAGTQHPIPRQPPCSWTWRGRHLPVTSCPGEGGGWL